eukprot:scaffold422_cov399-Prasinococcus_capsulatus_cf.AAC.15
MGLQAISGAPRKTACLSSLAAGQCSIQYELCLDPQSRRDRAASSDRQHHRVSFTTSTASASPHT